MKSSVLDFRLHGHLLKLGQSVKKGADMTTNQINALGGIRGKQIKVGFQDTQGDLKQAMSVAQKFASHPQVLVAMERRVEAFLGARLMVKGEKLDLWSP
jgi:ABC-type branched-subunit amino acid transport system substrate-binding protein